LKIKKGDILNMKNEIIGEHEGAWFYTIGQRRNIPQLAISNLQIGQYKDSIPPLYVIKTDVKKNVIWLGEEKNLFQKKLIATNINWLDKYFEKQLQANKKINCSARIRYHHKKEGVEVENRKLKGELSVNFKKPQRAITPGQSIVLYRNNQLLAGGIIDEF
jgi:tRNA-specific 2-thiouridylase